MTKKNNVTDIRLKHIENDIKEIKGSLKTQTGILKCVAVQGEKIKAIDKRLTIHEKKVEKTETRTLGWLWNLLTIVFSITFAAIISFFGIKK